MKAISNFRHAPCPCYRHLASEGAHGHGPPLPKRSLGRNLGQKVGHPVYVGFIGGISIFGEGTIVGAYTTVG